MNNKRLDILASPLFVISLLLLILNDWYLKQAFHNELTGKLSDISGLFLCFLLAYSLIPKYPKLIIVILSLGFVYWKIPASQWIIDLWNSQGYVNINRTVDYTDLLALPVMLLAWFYAETRKPKPIGSIYRNMIIISSVLAIAGTSMPPSKEEMVIINKIEKVRKDRVSNYVFASENLDKNIINKFETLLAARPDPKRLQVNGIEVEIWQSSRFDAITYNFDTFYINTWIFHEEPDKLTEYNISPRNECDRQLALQEKTDITPFRGANFRFYRKESRVQFEEVELILCDIPSRKSKKEALDYFIQNYIYKIEKAFL